VDWREWGDEAFQDAAARDVPVLVSIGYSTCHWCHVMARESFSDPVVAAYLNENFVAIKVDREEYPDVDASYLAAASAFTRDLGWPLNVFVTPAGRPFFAGTYFPPVAVGGHQSFSTVLGAVAEAFTTRRSAVEESSEAIVEALASVSLTPGALPTEFDTSRLESLEDAVYGGFGTAPKFPVAPVLGYLLEIGSPLALRTLDAMAASPLRDPVEGGFFRYATRQDWSEPHYERMLYDNALLLAAYARAGRVEVATGIANFLIDVMLLPSGGFASAQDSESILDGKRVEGGYYTAESREGLTPPALDEKVLTGWNGLAIEALAVAGRLLDRPDWIAVAVSVADFLLDRGMVRASIRDRVSAAPATLEDYGMLANGLLELAIATGEVRFASEARRLVESAGTIVPDATLNSHGLAVSGDPSEGAYPSGVSALANAKYTLYLLGGGPLDTAALELLAPLAEQQPMAFGGALTAMARIAAPVRQLVIVGSTLGSSGGSSLADVAQHWRGPGVAIAVSPAQSEAWAREGFELFRGRDREAAYVCEHFVCRLPVTARDELLALL